MTSRLPASNIMIIRHGEKPLGGQGDPVGVTEDGQPDEHALTVRGWQRAGALAALLAAPPRSRGLAVPGLLACPDYPDGAVGHRVHQTLQPLAALLDLPTRTLGTTDDPADAAAAALAPAAPVVLLCWDHENLPTLARLPPCTGTVPATWPGDCFDQIWVFDRVPSSAPVRYAFSISFQHVLGGDQ